MAGFSIATAAALGENLVYRLNAHTTKTQAVMADRCVDLWITQYALGANSETGVTVVYLLPAGVARAAALKGASKRLFFFFRVFFFFLFAFLFLLCSLFFRFSVFLLGG